MPGLNEEERAKIREAVKDVAGEEPLSRSQKRARQYVGDLLMTILNHYKKPLWEKGPLESRIAQAYAEAELEWLESFAQGPNGFNMGCGEIPVGDSEGVDMILTLGAWKGVAFCPMDDMYEYKAEVCDYIISNYIESSPNPCKLFTEWHRLLKPGGKVAILCKDADQYSDNSIGPLKRSGRGAIKKHCCYTAKTIRFYLQFCEFTVDSIEVSGPNLKVEAHK